MNIPLHVADFSHGLQYIILRAQCQMCGEEDRSRALNTSMLVVLPPEEQQAWMREIHPDVVGMNFDICSVSVPGIGTEH